MSQLSLTKTSLNAGVWQGILTGRFDGDGAPTLKVTHLDQPVPGVEVAPGQWRLGGPHPDPGTPDFGWGPKFRHH